MFLIIAKCICVGFGGVTSFSVSDELQQHRWIDKIKFAKHNLQLMRLDMIQNTTYKLDGYKMPPCVMCKLNRLKGTGLTPNYRSWYQNDCFVSVAAGTYQKNTWSAINWFSVNICSVSVNILETE